MKNGKSAQKKPEKILFKNGLQPLSEMIVKVNETLKHTHTHTHTHTGVTGRHLHTCRPFSFPGGGCPWIPWPATITKHAVGFAGGTLTHFSKRSRYAHTRVAGGTLGTRYIRCPANTLFIRFANGRLEKLLWNLNDSMRRNCAAHNQRLCPEPQNPPLLAAVTVYRTVKRNACPGCAKIGAPSLAIATDRRDLLRPTNTGAA